jgi:hypothetical protein
VTTAADGGLHIVTVSAAVAAPAPETATDGQEEVDRSADFGLVSVEATLARDIAAYFAARALSPGLTAHREDLDCFLVPAWAADMAWPPSAHYRPGRAIHITGPRWPSPTAGHHTLFTSPVHLWVALTVLAGTPGRHAGQQPSPAAQP